MNENTVTISTSEYYALVQNRTRLNILIDYVEYETKDTTSTYIKGDFVKMILGMDVAVTAQEVTINDNISD